MMEKTTASHCSAVSFSSSKGTSLPEMRNMAAKLLEAFQGQGQKCRHHARIEMSARAALDLRARRRDGNGARVRAIVRHGVEGVGHREDARAQGDVLAPEPVGIAGAVPALV